MTTTKKYLPSEASFDIESFPFYWVARLDALYGQEMDKTLKKQGMDLARWRVCMLLRSHQQLIISDIAKHAIRKVPTTTKIVQRMEDEGLLFTRKDNTDGRARVVQLTALGNKKINTILSLTKPLFEQAFDGLSDDEIEQLNRLINQVFNNLSY